MSDALVFHQTAALKLGNTVFFPPTSLYSVHVSHLQDCEFLKNRVVLVKDENTGTSRRQASILKRKNVCVRVWGRGVSYYVTISHLSESMNFSLEISGLLIFKGN